MFLLKAKEKKQIETSLTISEAYNSIFSNAEISETEDIFHHISSRKLSVSVQEYFSDVQRIAESIRNIALKDTLKVIGMVGAVPKTGTSTLVASLMAFMAGSKPDRRAVPNTSESQVNSVNNEKSNNQNNGILLIDTHLKQPFQHRIFRVAISPGLTEFLTDQTSLETCIKPVNNSNLKLITTGGMRKVTLTQIGADKFEALLESAKSIYDFVFLDIPPLLHSAEGITISQYCDGVIIIVQAGQTRWQVVEEARHRLEKMGVNVLGGVLNKRKFFIPEWVYQRL